MNILRLSDIIYRQHSITSLLTCAMLGSHIVDIDNNPVLVNDTHAVINTKPKHSCLSFYLNFLMSLMMVDCMSSYCCWVIPPLSYNSCSCISCCTGCPHKLTRLLGENAALLLSLPPDALTDDLDL